MNIPKCFGPSLPRPLSLDFSSQSNQQQKWKSQNHSFHQYQQSQKSNFLLGDLSKEDISYKENIWTVAEQDLKPSKKEMRRSKSFLLIQQDQPQVHSEIDHLLKHSFEPISSTLRKSFTDIRQIPDFVPKLTSFSACSSPVFPSTLFPIHIYHHLLQQQHQQQKELQSLPPSPKSISGSFESLLASNQNSMAEKLQSPQKSLSHWSKRRTSLNKSITEQQAESDTESLTDQLIKSNQKSVEEKNVWEKAWLPNYLKKPVVKEPDDEKEKQPQQSFLNSSFYSETSRSLIFPPLASQKPLIEQQQQPLATETALLKPKRLLFKHQKLPYLNSNLADQKERTPQLQWTKKTTENKEADKNWWRMVPQCLNIKKFALKKVEEKKWKGWQKT